MQWLALPDFRLFEDLGATNPGLMSLVIIDYDTVGIGTDSISAVNTIRQRG
jgi:hypothetical protein